MEIASSFIRRNVSSLFCSTISFSLKHFKLYGSSYSSSCSSHTEFALFNLSAFRHSIRVTSRHHHSIEFNFPLEIRLFCLLISILCYRSPVPFPLSEWNELACEKPKSGLKSKTIKGESKEFKQINWHRCWAIGRKFNMRQNVPKRKRTNCRSDWYW